MNLAGDKIWHRLRDVKTSLKDWHILHYGSSKTEIENIEKLIKEKTSLIQEGRVVGYLR